MHGVWDDYQANQHAQSQLESIEKCLGGFPGNPGLPLRYRQAHLLTPAAEDWFNGLLADATDQPFLFVSGSTGTGKTYLAAALVRCFVTAYLLDQLPGLQLPGSFFQWWSQPSLLDALRPRRGRSDDEMDDLLNACKGTCLLVLDDFGSEKPSEWTQEQVFMIIDHRYANCMPTIITTNLAPAEVQGIEGSRLVSRLQEAATVIRLVGPDRRSLAS